MPLRVDDGKDGAAAEHIKPRFLLDDGQPRQAELILRVTLLLQRAGQRVPLLGRCAQAELADGAVVQPTLVQIIQDALIFRQPKLRMIPACSRLVCSQQPLSLTAATLIIGIFLGFGDRHVDLLG